MNTTTSFIRYNGVKSEFVLDSVVVSGNVHVDISGSLSCTGLQVKLEGFQGNIVTVSLNQLFPSINGRFVNNFFIFPFQFVLPPNVPCSNRAAGLYYTLSASIVE